MKTILIIDDDRLVRESLNIHLQEVGFRVIPADRGDEGLKKFKEEPSDIIILDIRLPDTDGLTILRSIRESNQNIPVIIITAFSDMHTTIHAMKIGADEYIHKPIDIDELDLIIKRIIKKQESNRRLEGLVTEVSREYQIGNIIGRSPEMLEIFKTIGIVSESKTTVLIQGESGTGKELIARAIHYNSDDKSAPFIPVNCSALVETLLESELFGHEKGAFTGALYRREGKFELADGGTIFLDEIGDMSQNLQTKLLRVLQEKEFERVGGREKVKVDVRVITATNRTLSEMVKEGKFREDLYYRIKVVTIDVPPLRERKEDIPLLAAYLLNKINLELHKNVRKVPEDVMNIFCNYSWKGNVRELENVITRAVVLCRGEVLLKEYLTDFPSPDFIEKKREVELKSIKETEKELIETALRHTNWNKGKTCAILGISYPTLQKKIFEY
ncbi:MAG: sigma-54-dependent Fis family transcriptional regulator, partial [Nitrospinae bacterium]|nr:sigma-54-dependent Fis family transcriptional regulator [Nitrospinota bacterium]